MSQTIKTGKRWVSKDPFDQLVAILITVATMIVALLGFVDADASGWAAQALREAGQFNTTAAALRNRGEVQVGYAWSDAYRQWQQMDALAAEARQQGDEAAAARYTAARDRLAKVSPLLAPPYFDPAVDAVPRVNAYEADLYLIETTALSEQANNRMVAENAWRDKATTYGTCIILFAVVLFQYGLATTVEDRARWVPMATGSLLAVISLGLALHALLVPIKLLPETAINSYARGVGLAYQEDHAGALQAYGQALEQAPDYANAYYGRAQSQFDLANFEAAAQDYQAAIAAGKDDVSTHWNLAWTWYRMGRFAESIQESQQALKLDSGLVAVQYNLGLANLAKGDIEAARAAYTTANDLATRQVVSAHDAGEEPAQTLWWYLSTAGSDLDNLADCLQRQECTRAPPVSTLANSEAARTAADELRLSIKNLATALEYTGAGPVEASGGSLAEMAFVQPVYDPQGAVTAYAPLDLGTVRLRGAGVYQDPGEAADVSLLRVGGVASEVVVSFDYSGMKDGQLVVVKVYVNGVESPGLRLVQTWALGESGKATLPLTPGGAYGLSPGQYRVEIYVDSRLVQSGGFTVPGSAIDNGESVGR